MFKEKMEKKRTAKKMKFNLGDVFLLLSAIGICTGIIGFVLDDTIIYAVGVMLFSFFIYLALICFFVENYTVDSKDFNSYK